MGMRIVGGKYRHLQINYPETFDTRPTMDKVREAIFSALGNNVVDARILDLFAGSGAMGLEALSRGAKTCTFVDKSKVAIDCVKSNLVKIKVSEPTKIILNDALSYLETLGDEQFDILFLDPPYANKPIYFQCISHLIHNNNLTENGIIVLESDDGKLLDSIEMIESFSSYKQYKYGHTFVYIIRR
jgi:16S rRNA (guanine(966)-N(2))-methyltransferase RsmD